MKWLTGSSFIHPPSAAIRNTHTFPMAQRKITDILLEEHGYTDVTWDLTWLPDSFRLKQR